MGQGNEKMADWLEEGRRQSHRPREAEGSHFPRAKAKMSLGAVLSSEELQEAPGAEMLWRNASCSPHTW